jgi:predicted DNA-binding protein
MRCRAAPAERNQRPCAKKTRTKKIRAQKTHAKKHTILNLYRTELDMAISLRLPLDIESQLVSFSARQGVSKSALVVRSIQEFLARNAQPSAYDLYLDALKTADDAASTDARRDAMPVRSSKLAARTAMQAKHAERSARATRALATTQNQRSAAP